MQIIVPPAPSFEQIAGKQKSVAGRSYRWMSYVIQCPVKDGVLLYHTLTCNLIFLTNEEANHLTARQDLIDRWFLVPQEHDDRKLCHQVRQMSLLLQPSKRSIKRYTILPTTGCNARCFYCFERGTRSFEMTPDTACKVSNYIISHRAQEKVKINWFGGEPLVNVSAIDQICAELKDKNVPFSSKMISNGYLFNPEIISRATKIWALQDVQITLDGLETTYIRTKRYIEKHENPFERVLQNIELLTKAGIRVVVRLNVDKHNIDEMSDLVKYLHLRFGKNQYLFIYSHELFGERPAEERAILFEQRRELEQLIEECGYKRHLELQKDIVLNRCMADDDQSVLINPEGYLGKCEHYINSDFFGHVDNEGWDIQVINRFKERPEDSTDCISCPFYPQCFRLKMCGSGYLCTKEMQQERMMNLFDAMKNEYQNYLNHKPHEADI